MKQCKMLHLDFTMKVPSNIHEPNRVKHGWLMDIGKAKLYEQEEQLLGL